MKDIKAATMVIAQKSQANDELGNDLVQANRLIVNFNNQHEAVTQEVSIFLLGPQGDAILSCW